jgi:hypothetical protein
MSKHQINVFVRLRKGHPYKESEGPPFEGIIYGLDERVTVRGKDSYDVQRKAKQVVFAKMIEHLDRDDVPSSIFDEVCFNTETYQEPKDTEDYKMGALHQHDHCDAEGAYTP